jgi:hypothetical protein
LKEIYKKKKRKQRNDMKKTKKRWINDNENLDRKKETEKDT